MDSKASRMDRMFSSIAARYDLANSVLSFRRDSYWRRFAVGQSEVEKGALVLDVGTGTGKLVSDLVKASGARAVGIDLCEDMLRKARKTVGEGTVEFALCQAESLPFPDDVFDNVISGFTLRNVSDLSRTLEEMVRVVKVGGRVVCLEFVPPSRSPWGLAYRTYLATVIPVLGWLLSGQRSPYTHLPGSIKDFKRPDELKQMMQKAGLADVSISLLTLGRVAVHAGTKAER